MKLKHGVYQFLIVILCLQISTAARGSESCQELFPHHVISSNEAFRAIKNLPKQQKATVVHDLLKDAFYPMMERIRDLGQKIPAKEIQAKLREYQASNPIKEAKYQVDEGGKRYPIMNIQSSWGPRSQALIQYNTTGGNNMFYNWQNNSAFAMHASNKALYIEPSQNLIKDYGIFFQMLSTIPTPVNAYGQNFSSNLLRTTQIMMELVGNDPVLREMANQAHTQNLELFSEEVGRVKMARSEGTDPKFAAVSGAMEGILSLHQFLSNTLGEKIPGAATGAEALDMIVKNSADQRTGLVAEFTSRLTMGLNAPLSISGYHFKSVYQVEANGKLSLTSQLKDALAVYAKKVVESPSMRKGRCPMAGMLKRLNLPVPKFMHSKIESIEISQAPAIVETAPPGLQLLAETYLRIFSIINTADEVK